MLAHAQRDDNTTYVAMEIDPVAYFPRSTVSVQM